MFQYKIDCTLHCHGRNSGSQCTNTGDSAAPSSTIRLALNITRITLPRSSQIQTADEQIHEEILASGGRLGLLVIPLLLEIAPTMVQRVALRLRLAQRVAPIMVQRAVLRLGLAQRIVLGVI